MVEVGDTVAFLDRTMQLKNDPELLKTLTKNARKEAEKWSWNASMAKLHEEQNAVACQNFHD